MAAATPGGVKFRISSHNPIFCGTRKPAVCL
jgi:hypothetical protein